MKITDLQKQIENLPEKLRTSILAIIEIKTEIDMEKVLSKMDIQFKVIVGMMGIAFTLIGLLLTIYKFIG
ncbi:hypothetical protein [Abyssalbus ytuae]|uniref:Uncharacterized protein n=1 Tax=Abyssalbus ytuae TaxID=2926907 RepID=A0A9E6ZP55_9FLAO|nr:hypothetical protein [Abyssalbus ytuae]UOB16158.1 hypothetical protein MQE35_10455 [Abyssalbus ytuae]